MIRLLLGCLLLSLGVGPLGYAQTFERTSVDAGGASVSAGAIELVYTLGEVHVAERSNGTLNVSEGFLPISPFCLGGLTQWNGVSWNNGLPDASKIAQFAGNYHTDVQDADIEACSCQIDAGATVTISADRYALVSDRILVNGTLLVEHQGNVVQVNKNATVINNDFIQVQVQTPDLDDRDFMVLGSPVTDEQREEVFGNAIVVLDHDTHNFVPHPEVEAQFPDAENFADDNNDFWIHHTGRIAPGGGYLVRPQSSYGGPGGIFDLDFDRGTLNNGDISFDVVYNTSQNDSPNILGNPYPSAISADDFINENAMINELYFWEHLTPPSPDLPGANAMNFSMEDISMYNLMGGIAAASDPTGTTAPHGIIATAQGFGIKATTAGTALFTNAMRRTTGNTTLRFAEEVDRIWLRVRNETYGLASSILIGFSENTTAGIDNGYDSRRLASIVSLYSHLEDGTHALGIQSREGFEDRMKIPLGFSTLVDTETEYTISISQLEGMNLEGADVYLYDKRTMETVLLNENDYSFLAHKGTFDNRFTLLFIRETLRVEDHSSFKAFVYPNPASETLSVFVEGASMTSVEVRDVHGRLIRTEAMNPTDNTTLKVHALDSGVYLLTIHIDGHALVKRFIKQ